MKKILEICVDSLASARIAIAAGADRLELCSALAVGGLTPYKALLQQIRRESEIPVRCLMRPRPGDFLYTKEEIQMMAKQVRSLKEAGASGFVIGCLTAEGDLDKEAMKPILEACDESAMTLHRCVDVSRDPLETYMTAGSLGIDTVLTSGGAGNCWSGRETIGEMLRLRDLADGPEVLIGAGVNAAVIQEFRKEFQGAGAFHMSGKTEIESAMAFRREGVPMGMPGLDEWHIQQTSVEAVLAAAKALEN